MADGESKKVLCGILGIILGAFGVHRFMLGDTQGGIIRIVISLATCFLGGWIGVIEGIIYLTKSDEDFERIYVQGGKKWF